MSANKVTSQDISIEKPALEKGGAAFKGLGESVKINTFCGDSSVSIPIFASKAREFTPELNIAYHTSWGNGVYGLGFRLNLPSIFRKNSGKLPVYFDEADIFLLDDEELLLIDKENFGSWDIWVYTLREQKEFQRIEYWKEKTNSFWKIISKDGTISFWGKDEDAKVANPDNNANIFKWHLESCIDSKGNKIKYNYVQHDSICYLNSIFYGNYFCEDEEKFAFELHFDYKDRMDNFISYRSGFKIETKKLCHRISMIHNFENTPKIIRDTYFEYEEDRVSLLKKIAVTCYRYSETGKPCESMELPPICFEYTPFQTESHNFGELKVEQGILTDKITTGKFRFIDLYGEGVSGIVYSSKEGVWYYEPLGNGNFKKPARIDEFPIDRDIEKSFCTFKSLAGNGVYDLVVEKANRAGYYEQINGTWQKFNSFDSCVNEANNSRISVDLQGDKLEHLLFMEENQVKYYPSLKKKGYGLPVRTLAQDDFPKNTQVSSPYEKIFYIDIFGDGLKHCVKVSNGHIECWANLGYGKFDKKTVLEGFSYIENDFKAENVHFADITGLGPVDLIYVHKDRFDVYFNRGNGVFSPPVSFWLPVKNTNFVDIDFADLKGSGVSSMIITQMGTDVSHYYLDFCQGQKPYLLKCIDNGSGLETKISYTSSVEFYLKDKNRDVKWYSTIPFPIFVVSQMQTTDKITGVCDKKEYFYRDPFYDNEENKFVGFSAVEEKSYIYNYDENLQIDTKTCGVYKKRWYHSKIGHEYAGQFNLLDKTAYYPANCIFDVKEKIYLPQAKKILWGKTIREETYLLDCELEILESIEHYNYTVRQDSDLNAGSNPNPEEQKQSFFVYQSEMIKYTYTGADIPVAVHNFILEVDKYGNVTNECNVFYQTDTENSNLAISLKLTDYAFAIKEKQAICQPSQIRDYEINPNTIKKAKKYFSFTEIKEKISQALLSIVPYGEEFDNSILSARLFKWQKNFYWDEVQNSVLPFAKIALPALVHHTAKAVFPENFTGEILGADIGAEDIKEYTGYQYEDGYYWNCGVVFQYYGKNSFYLLKSTENSINSINSRLYSKTETQYDKYNLLPVLLKTWVAQGFEENTISAEIDYDYIKYKRIIDFNNNVEEVLFYPSGLTRVYSKYGLADKQRQGNRDLQNYKIQKEELADIINNPQEYLQGASNYFFYDFNAYSKFQKPIAFVELITPHLDEAESGDIQCKITYKDGRGNAIETKEKTQTQWAVSQYTLYKDNDNPFLKYNPFFSPTYEFDDKHSLIKMPEIYVYDGLNRQVCVKKPVGFANISGYVYVKKVYMAGRELYFDEISTVKDSSYYDNFIKNKSQEEIYSDYQDTFKKAEDMQGFYTVKLLDAQNNMIMQSLGENDYFKYKYDLNNNITEITDSSNKRHMQYIYDMTGNKVKIVSCDMGSEITIFNIYNKVVYKLDAKGVKQYNKYDWQNRLKERFIEGAGVVEKIIYGEEAQNNKEHNLRGQIYKYYDQAGVQTNKTYDIYGQVIFKTKELCQDYINIKDWRSDILLEEIVWEEQYKYNRTNDILWHKGADGSTEELSYDQRGLLKNQKITQNGKTKLSVCRLEYDASGNPVHELLGNGVSNKFKYNANSGNLEQITTQNSNSKIIQNKRYIYDPAGNISRIRDLEALAVNYAYHKGQKAVAYLDYKYDKHNRLTEAIGRELPQSALPHDLQKLETYTEKYSYDISGNLLSIKHTSVSTNWTRNFDVHNLNNRISKIDGQKVHYDDNGNMTNLPNGPKLAWNYDNLVLRADILRRETGNNDSEYYVYDYTGQRVRKILLRKLADNLTQQEEKIYLGGLEIKRVSCKTGLTFEKQSRYLIIGGARSAAWHSTQDDERQEFITYSGCDQIKSVNLETNEAGEVITLEEFYPYGDTAFINGAAREVSKKQYRYCSKEKDSLTGLYYYQSRYYSPHCARMISGDDFKYLTLGDWHSFNRYIYCKNNPVNYIDIDGHNPFSVDEQFRNRDYDLKFYHPGDGYIKAATAISAKNIYLDTSNRMFYLTTAGMHMTFPDGKHTYVITEDGENLIIDVVPESTVRRELRYPHPCLVGGWNPKVSAAGMLHFKDGKIEKVDNMSGHFKPDISTHELVRKFFRERCKIILQTTPVEFSFGFGENAKISYSFPAERVAA